MNLKFILPEKKNNKNNNMKYKINIITNSYYRLRIKNNLKLLLELFRT